MGSEPAEIMGSVRVSPARDRGAASRVSRDPVRLAWPDYGKGIAIVLVVICHVSEGFSATHPLLTPPAWRDFVLISYAFMVPVFFVVAGWFSERTFDRRGAVYQLGHVARNILYPYVLWSVLQTALMILSKAGNRVPSWSDLPAFLLSGTMQFWFLRALVLSYGADILLRAMGLSVSIRLFLSAVLLAVFSIFPHAGSPAVVHPATHFFYFVAGAFCFRFGVRLQGTSLLLWAAVLGFSALIVLHFAHAACDTPFRPFAAVAGVIGCLSVSALLPQNRWLSWLRFLGVHSLPIFCLHVIFAAGVRAALLKAGVNNLAFHVFVGSIAGLFLPLTLSVASAGRFDWLFRIPTPLRSEP